MTYKSHCHPGRIESARTEGAEYDEADIPQLIGHECREESHVYTRHI